MFTSIDFGFDSSPTLCHPCSSQIIQQVDLNIIVSIAVSVRRALSNCTITCTVGGGLASVSAHHAAWAIDFEDGVHWVFRTPLIDNSPILEKRIKSDICGIHLIQSRTNIPIPCIIDFSATSDNMFGRPYAIMEKPQGIPLSSLWTEPEGVPIEKRKILFKSLASAMSKLKVLEFDRIGSLYIDEKTGSYTVGSTIPSYEEILDGHHTTRGTYSTTHTYLLGEIRRKLMSLPGETDDEREPFLALLRVFAGFIPDHNFDEQPFVLSSPNLDLHSIFVDEDWDVTAITEWDSLFVGPREGGYAKYPSWITLDWDPIIDRYPFKKIDYNPRGDLDINDLNLDDSEEELVDDDGESRDSDDEALGYSRAPPTDQVESQVERPSPNTCTVDTPPNLESRKIATTDSFHNEVANVKHVANVGDNVSEASHLCDNVHAGFPTLDAGGSEVHRNEPNDYPVPLTSSIDGTANTPGPIDSSIPAMLDGFRKEYLEAFTEVDPDSARYTQFSHLFNALERTAHSSKAGMHILYKFKEFLFGPFTTEGDGFLLEVPVLLKRLTMGQWMKDLKD